MSSVFNSTESQPGLIWTAVGRHTDWFLHHKERGVKNLGALIAAELAIIAFYFTHTAELQSINRIVGLVLLLAGLLGIPLVRLAITSATRSFQAAMECISLASKCLWAMGLTARLTLNPDSVDTKNIPAPDNTHLPWEGKVVARGLEFGTTPFGGTMKDVLERGSIYGVPVYRWIAARERTTTRYVAFLTEIPSGFKGVDDVRVGDGKIVITERDSGNEITLKSERQW